MSSSLWLILQWIGQVAADGASLGGFFLPSAKQQAEELIPLAEKEEDAPLLLLVGDAGVTAHYRLGVGVNAIFSNLADLGDFNNRKDPPAAVNS